MSQTLPVGWALDELFWGDPSMASSELVTGITANSRTIKPGDVFLAYPGLRSHGLDYVSDAVEKHVRVIVWEPTEQWSHARVAELAQQYPVTFKAYVGLSSTIGRLAERFFGYPSKNLQMIGITGTNGKTSCIHYIAHALNQKAPCGMIGTLGYGLYQHTCESGMTTPDAVRVHRLLAQMRDQNAQAVAMEVSSHALDQGRVDAVHFDVAVLTNVSHDHLDYHGDMPSYLRAKQRLFQREDVGTVVLNADDPVMGEFHQVVKPGTAIITYGAQRNDQLEQHIWLHDVTQTQTGLAFQISSPWGDARMMCALFGRFNVLNLGAALGVLIACGMELPQAVQLLQTCETAPGRLEFFQQTGQPSVFVDYAHTPDALLQALHTVSEHFTGKCFCVFGCGGDRDKDKRPMMGAIAERQADHVIVTDDNPRSEDGDAIIQQILAGMQHPARATIARDRQQAIQHAVACATENDVVLVAGKGHEADQIIGTQRQPFSDRTVVQELLQ